MVSNFVQITEELTEFENWNQLSDRLSIEGIDFEEFVIRILVCIASTNVASSGVK